MSLPFSNSNLTPVQQAVQTVSQSGNHSYSVLLLEFNRAYAAIWNNKSATPVEVVTGLGTQAVKLFTLSSLTATLLNTATPSLNLPTTVPDGFTFVANADGSVTLTAK